MASPAPPFDRGVSVSAVPAPLRSLPPSLLLAVSHVESRSHPFDDAQGEDDYRAFRVAGKPDASSTLPAAPSSAPSRLHRLLPRFLSGEKVLPSSSADLLSNPLSSISGAPSTLLPSSSSSLRRSADGFATALVHAPPHALLGDFLNASGPLFLLGGAGTAGGGKAGGGGGGGGGGEEGRKAKGVKTRQWLKGSAWKTTAKPATEDIAAVIAPCVLSKVGEREFNVLTFRRPHTMHNRTGREVLMELLHRVVLVEGNRIEGDVTVVYFETADEKTLTQESLDLIARRRERTETHFHVVSGKQQGYIIMTPDLFGCTRVKLVTASNFDVELSNKTLAMLLKRSFAPLKAAQKKYECCDTIDELRMRNFVSMMPSVPAPTDGETAMLAKALKYDMDETKYTRVVGSLKAHPTTHMFIRTDLADVASTIMGHGDVDESAELVLAWIWFVCSYERRRAHYMDGNKKLVRRTNFNDSSPKRTQLFEVEYEFAPTIANRSFVLWNAWFQLEPTKSIVRREAYAIAFDTSDPNGAIPGRPEHDPPIFTKKAVRASTTGIYLFEKIAPRVTKYTMIQQSNMGGRLPTWLANAVAVFGLASIVNVQDRFRRVDRVVDKEINFFTAECIRNRDPRDTVPAEKDFFESCSLLKTQFEKDGESKSRVKLMMPTSPFVECTFRPSQMTDVRSAGGGRPVATGKAVAEIDTSMEEAVAWLFDMCSRERMRVNKETNANLPRVIKSSSESSSFVMGTIKHMPFPLQLREFVTRVMWYKLDSVSTAFVCQSVEENVDYGIPRGGAVRGATAAFQLIESTGRHSCLTTLYQTLDPCGSVPISVVDSNLESVLSIVEDLRNAFKRDDEVDVENRIAFAAEITALVGPPTAAETDHALDGEEEAVFEFVVDSLRIPSEITKVARIDAGSDHFVKVSSLTVERTKGRDSVRARIKNRGSPSIGDPTVLSFSNLRTVFTAEVVVDTDDLNCVAWEVLKSSRLRTQSFFDNEGGAFRKDAIVSRRCRDIVDTFFVDNARNDPIEVMVKSRVLWKKDGGFVVVEHHKKSEDMDSRRRRDRAAETLEPIPTNLIDEWIADAATDRLGLEAAKDRIRNDSGVYTAVEDGHLAACLEMENKVASGARIKELKTTHSAVLAEIAHLDDVVYGRASLLVRAPTTDVLALVLSSDLQYFANHEKNLNASAATFVDIPNNHRQINHVLVTAPPPFANREFLMDTIWRREGENKNDIFICSVPGHHDNAPLTPDVVRADWVRALRIVEVSPGVTRFTITFTMNLKGSIPKFIVKNMVIPGNLRRPVLFQRYFQLIKPVSDFDANGEDAIMLAQHLMDDVLPLSSTAERKAAMQQYFIRASSLRAIGAQHPWFQLLLWNIIKNHSQSSCMPCASPLRTFTFTDASTVGGSFAYCLRESLTPQSAVIMWFSAYPAMAELDVEFPLLRPFLDRIASRFFDRSRNHLLDKFVSETQFHPLEQEFGVPMTKVVSKFTHFAKQQLFSEEEQTLMVTRRLSEVRRYFDKGSEIDRRRQKEFCNAITVQNEVYTDIEMAQLAEGMAHLSTFRMQKATAIKMYSPTIVASAANTGVGSSAWGWAMGTIRGSPAEVLGFIWDVRRRGAQYEDDLERSIDEEANNHNQLVYVKKRSPAFLDCRDYLSRGIWRSSSGGSFEYVFFPVTSARRPASAGVVRGKFLAVAQVLSFGDSETKLEYVVHPDSGGVVPSIVMQFYLRQFLEYVYDVQDHFQRSRSLSVFDERDGVAVGEVFSLRTKEEMAKNASRSRSRLEMRVATVVQNHAALKEFAAKNPWFPSLVVGMLRHWLRDPVIITTKLDNISNREASTIGRSFALALFDRQQADAGVDMFINEYPALIELEKRERFFAPMAITIGQRKLDKAPWGLVFKVGTGAILAVLDVVTDLYAIVNFMQRGKLGFARAVIAMVSISIAAQLMIVHQNGRRRGVRHLALESVFVLSGFKPVVDAFRVISGVQAQVEDLQDPMVELTASKMAEIVAESIPSTLVQLYAMIISGDKSIASLASVVISIATISWGSTTLSFDYDLNPSSRLTMPSFYGYLPNSSGKRTLAFIAMFLFSVCHVSLKALGVVLFAIFNPVLLGAVLGGEIVFFLLFKSMRDDLRYWMKFEGTFAWILTFFVRLVTKLMVDFTVMIQLRHPNEIGGVYWMICLLFGQLTAFVAVYLISLHEEEDDDATRNSSYESSNGNSSGTTTNMFSSSSMWTIVGVLEVSFVVFFAKFFFVIKKEYRGTFFSTLTAKRFQIQHFLDAQTDQAKFDLFWNHESYWQEIRRDVEVWVKENYSTWIEEQPEWFTDRVRASIPKDMVSSALSTS